MTIGHSINPEKEPKYSTLPGLKAIPSRLTSNMIIGHSTNPEMEPKKSILPRLKAIPSRVTSNMSRDHYHSRYGTKVEHSTWSKINT